METLNEISKICVSAVNGTDDREAHEKFWVAAYTRPRCEKKAVAEIKKLGIETYLPTHLSEITHSLFGLSLNPAKQHTQEFQTSRLKSLNLY